MSGTRGQEDVPLVTLNGRFLSRAATGVDRYAGEVLRSLDIVLAEARDAGAASLPDVELLVPVGAAVPDLRFVRVRELRGLRGQAWEQITLPIASAGRLLVNLCNTAPVCKRNQVVIIYDAATRRMPDSFSRLFRTWYRMLLPVVGRVSRLVATVSEFSRGEIVEAFGIPPAKVRVLPAGAEHLHRVQADAGILARHGLHKRPFVLAVGSLVPQKNFALVQQAMALCPQRSFDVAIAGGANPRVNQPGAAAGGDIKWLGYVSNAELRALYESASAFVFPSLYEGFGLPPLEAMSFGCPVICAKAASLPEVCGQAVLYIDPKNPVELRDAILRLLADPELAQELRVAGLARASIWTWRAAAFALLALIYDAASMRVPPAIVVAQQKAFP